MQKKLLERYANLKEMIKAHETECKLLSAEIMNEIEQTGENKYESDFGSFTVCVKTSYQYSDKIKELEEKVSIAKNKEVEQGRAKAVESNYLLFKPQKCL